LRPSLEISTKLRFVCKVTFRVFLANPSEDVEVGGEERESHCLVEVTRCESQEKGENDSKPEVGGSEEKIVVAAVDEEVRGQWFEVESITNNDELATRSGVMTL